MTDRLVEIADLDLALHDHIAGALSTAAQDGAHGVEGLEVLGTFDIDTLDDAATAAVAAIQSVLGDAA